MTAARDEIMVELAALAPGSPARKVLERILKKLTTNQLRGEIHHRVRIRAGRREVAKE